MIKGSPAESCSGGQDIIVYPGALAQLGERFAGSEEVRGSIPLGSITKEPAKHKDFRVFGGFLLCESGVFRCKKFS